MMIQFVIITETSVVLNKHMLRIKIICPVIIMLMVSTLVGAQSLSITPTGGNTVCMNQDYNYTANISGYTDNVSSCITFFWTVSGGSFVGSSNSRSVTVRWSGNGTLTANAEVTDGDLAGGCDFAFFPLATKSVTMGSSASGSLSASSSHSGIFCPGDNANLTASVSGDANYLGWYNESNVRITTSPNLPVSVPGTYTAKAQLSSSCVNETLTRNIYLNGPDANYNLGTTIGDRVVYKNVENVGAIEVVGSNAPVDFWEKREASGNWNNIGNSGSYTFAYNESFTQQTQYRAKVSKSCPTEPDQYLNTATISVIELIPDKNSISAFSLDENQERVGESVSYFDDSGQLEQTQTKNQTDDIIFINAPIYDIYDRNIGSSLGAPLDRQSFGFKDGFISFGANPDYEPGPVDTDAPGTLGWYYSGNNDIEDNVPTTAYPYSQIEYYDDGTGDIRRSAGVGEELRLGSGHEVYSRTFGVTTELNDYVEIRNQLFELAAPTTLTGEAIQTITIDQNGNKAVSFSDRSQNVLLTARAISAATDLAVKPAYTMEDKSYNFYDDAGRLKVSIAPNGVLAIEAAGGIATFTDLNDLPFTTYYTYNHQGWLLSTKETDAGITEYKYRKDGSIRFSQNAQQTRDDHFSYTDYDNLGRPIESGEYIGSLGFGSGLNSRLEDRGFNTWLASDKKDWVKTYYDLPDPDMDTETGLSLTQDFVIGAVSYTENEHIKTWYSYDEQGRVTWMAQQPKALTRTFIVEYAYDFLGNVLSVGFTSYFGATPLDEFYHYYTYDADKRLSSVYTSLVGGLALATINTNSNAELQAHYEYYLHGPLKRIELGGNLQGIDFVYNIQGWLKQINHPDPDNDPGGDGSNGFSEDAFGMLLNYYNTNKSNLFGTAVNHPNPSLFHGLPGELNEPDIQLAQLFHVLTPDRTKTSIFKPYSAEQPLYEKLLKDFAKKGGRNDG